VSGIEFGRGWVKAVETGTRVKADSLTLFSWISYVCPVCGAAFCNSVIGREVIVTRCICISEADFT